MRSTLSASEKARNFVKLNCAAIPLGLLEKRTLRHERGAFDGDHYVKIGRPSRTPP